MFWWRSFKSCYNDSTGVKVFQEGTEELQRASEVFQKTFQGNLGIFRGVSGVFVMNPHMFQGVGLGSIEKKRILWNFRKLQKVLLWFHWKGCRGVSRSCREVSEEISRSLKESITGLKFVHRYSTYVSWGLKTHAGCRVVSGSFRVVAEEVPRAVQRSFRSFHEDSMDDSGGFQRRFRRV